MVKKLDEINLNLGKERVLGWHSIDRLNFEVLTLAREMGHVLPRVDVVFEDRVYRLLFGNEFSENYGGHTRAKVAFETDGELRCNLFDAHMASSAYIAKYQHIKDLPFADDNKCNIKYKLKKNLDYLPVLVANRFIVDNNFIVTERGGLMDLGCSLF
jgi:hypothetical protein